MSKNKNRRPQTPKVGNPAMNKAFQELRRSNAAGPHRSATDYRRKPKHSKKGWDE
jgi:hypothetical protein